MKAIAKTAITMGASLTSGALCYAAGSDQNIAAGLVGLTTVIFFFLALVAEQS